MTNQSYILIKSVAVLSQSAAIPAHSASFIRSSHLQRTDVNYSGFNQINSATNPYYTVNSLSPNTFLTKSLLPAERPLYSAKHFTYLLNVPCGSMTNFLATPLSKSAYPCGASSSDMTVAFTTFAISAFPFKMAFIS